MYYLNVYFELLKKNPIKLIGVPAGIRTWKLPNTNQIRNPLYEVTS